MDIGMYEYADDKKGYCKIDYYGFGLEKNRFKMDWIFPLGNVAIVTRAQTLKA